MAGKDLSTVNQTRSRATAPELALHERLVAGDPTASAELAERYLPPLTERLLRARRDVRDPQLVQQAVIDAVFSYIERPQQYHPERGSLESYLLMAARGDLDNALRAERRHSLRDVPLDDAAPAVELLHAGRNVSVEEQVLDRLGPDLPSGLDRTAALRLVAEEFPDSRDRRLLYLIVEDERRTAVFAQVLGIADLPEAEQRSLVKRHKDRIQVRVKRLRARVERENAAKP
jgi:hypothetical protein